ncbi:hypothetical protein OQH61_03485 [Helicobacter sp. MIT 21-1697]|uniref:hypothetical protein n=1 Tax=Helicobacter sp. MIT 21-1697 TaxID=2993733 RepID=UPI00224AEECF|nr:hypothetical protein [Helicobacter sp. MIT 21-1697]MCX2716796.1 hypothetical protein [Helicobacter sp. MIT 21-1697]
MTINGYNSADFTSSRAIWSNFLGIRLRGMATDYTGRLGVVVPGTLAIIFAVGLGFLVAPFFA